MLVEPSHFYSIPLYARKDLKIFQKTIAEATLILLTEETLETDVQCQEGLSFP